MKKSFEAPELIIVRLVDDDIIANVSGDIGEIGENEGND